MSRLFDQHSFFVSFLGLGLGLITLNSALEVKFAWSCLAMLGLIGPLAKFRKEDSGASSAENYDPEKAQFLMTLELLPIGIIIADSETETTVYRNRKMQEIWSPAAVKEDGQVTWKAHGKDGHLLRREEWPIVRTLRQGEQVSNEEIVIHHVDGRLETFLVSSSPVYDAKGHIIAGIGLCQDVSAQRRTEWETAELKISEQSALAASQLKSRFLTHMSHELRTPMNGILGMTRLLSQTPLSLEQASFCEAIRRSADSLHGMINDILDFSKITINQLDFESSPFQLETPIREACDLQELELGKKGLQLISNLSADLPQEVYGDPNRLRQVLNHILSNAVKFTERGSIHLRVKLLSQDEQKFKLLFEIEDSGIGIASEDHAQIFRAFSQVDSSTSRQHGGAGLGLSLCQHLVQRMGGEISFRSQEGEGSCFWFTVQLEKEALAARKKAEAGKVPNPSPTARPYRILIAEDVEINQIITRRMLEKLGYETEIVANGKEALLALETSAYDLVLMDCQMPQMDGYAATVAIRSSQTARMSSIPIIAMTANAMVGDREKCLSLGMNDYVSKPVHTKQLAEILLKWLPHPDILRQA